MTDNVKVTSEVLQYHVKSMVCTQGDWSRVHEVDSASTMLVENSDPVISRGLVDSQGGDRRLDTVS